MRSFVKVQEVHNVSSPASRKMPNCILVMIIVSMGKDFRKIAWQFPLSFEVYPQAAAERREGDIVDDVE